MGSSKSIACDAAHRKLLFELFPITLPAPPITFPDDDEENYDRGAENDYFAFQSLCSPTLVEAAKEPQPQVGMIMIDPKNCLLTLFSIQVV